MFTNRNPMGFKVLRTWQQANEIFELTEKYVTTLPIKHPFTHQFLSDLIDQMIRSCRSIVRNIEEGYSRNSTGEYLNFLGFSFGALVELIGDYEYCVKWQLGNQELESRGLRLCHGEAKMLHNQMESLWNKMVREKTFSVKDQARMILEQQSAEKKSFDDWLNKIIKEQKLRDNKG